VGISANNLKLVAQVWRKSKAKRPVVFLDRDGTIINFKEEVRTPSQIHLLRGTGVALRSLSERGFVLVLVTNQPIIEKKVITSAQLKKIHEHLRRVLKKQGAVLDAAYTCPHQYGTNCTCRKPEIGLIKQAQKDLSIDMKKSWFIGDTSRDMETGRRAKLKTILVKTGKAGKDVPSFKAKGNYTATSIVEAARIVKKEIL